MLGELGPAGPHGSRGWQALGGLGARFLGEGSLGRASHPLLFCSVSAGRGPAGSTAAVRDGGDRGRASEGAVVALSLKPSRSSGTASLGTSAPLLIGVRVRIQLQI